jgi:hypothetical protein
VKARLVFIAVWNLVLPSVVLYGGCAAVAYAGQQFLLSENPQFADNALSGWTYCFIGVFAVLLDLGWKYYKNRPIVDGVIEKIRRSG